MFSIGTITITITNIITTTIIVSATAMPVALVTQMHMDQRIQSDTEPLGLAWHGVKSHVPADLTRTDTVNVAVSITSTVINDAA